ncbi:MAG: cysteine desulfurase, partial [Pseudomonadota bacterium]
LTSADEILLTEMEHHANIVPWQLLQEEIGFTIKTIRVTDKGELDLDSFRDQLSHRTKFVGVVHISNALGTINPVKEMIFEAKDFYADMKILIDGSQAVVHSKVDVQDLGADFYVCTGHKIYGPTGIGALYVSTDTYKTMRPYQGGGDMIETVSFEQTTFKDAPYIFEAGTPPIVEIIGLGAAFDYMHDVGIENIEAHEYALLTYGTEQLKGVKGIKLYGEVEQKAGIMSFTLDYAHTSDVGMILDQSGVAVRTGHHCCMPLMQRYDIDGTVRASLGLYSNKDDIDQMIAGLEKVEELFA